MFLKLHWIVWNKNWDYITTLCRADSLYATHYDVIGLGYQTQASTKLPFIFGTGDVIWTMQTNDFRVTLRASFSSHCQ